jgi:hypothetical protein
MDPAEIGRAWLAFKGFCHAIKWSAPSLWRKLNGDITVGAFPVIMGLICYPSGYCEVYDWNDESIVSAETPALLMDEMLDYLLSVDSDKYRNATHEDLLAWGRIAGSLV